MSETIHGPLWTFAKEPWGLAHGACQPSPVIILSSFQTLHRVSDIGLPQAVNKGSGGLGALSHILILHRNDPVIPRL